MDAFGICLYDSYFANSLIQIIFVFKDCLTKIHQIDTTPL
jgi:hypothetical protein